MTQYDTVDARKDKEVSKHECKRGRCPVRVPRRGYRCLTKRPRHRLWVSRRYTTTAAPVVTDSCFYVLSRRLTRGALPLGVVSAVLHASSVNLPLA